MMETERLIEIMEMAGCDPTAYSGRGMYGGECLACHVNGGDIIQVISNLFGNVDDIDECKQLARMVFSARSDSFGLGEILYFPKIKYNEEEDA